MASKYLFIEKELEQMAALTPGASRHCLNARKMLELVRILLRITRLAHRKSYLVILAAIHIQSLSEVKLDQVGVCRTLLKVTHLASRKSYLFIICPQYI